MNNGLIRKYVMKKGDEGDFLHTSAYAKMQNGGNIGATGVRGESFAQRQERERKIVEGYGVSQIGGRVNGVKPKVYTGESGMRGGGVAPSPRGPTIPPKR